MSLCQCGCGEPTALAKQTEYKRGYVKGQPMRFKRGHGHRNTRTKPLETLYVTRDCGYDTPCWVWRGGMTTNGYGRTKHAGVMRPAHRVMYELHVGPIPEGHQIDHLCVNPPCVNPAHLEPVTARENTHRSRATKLTGEQVAEIRAEHARLLATNPLRRDGTRRVRTLPGQREELAHRYGVTSEQIKHIWAGRSWAQ